MFLEKQIQNVQVGRQITLKDPKTEVTMATCRDPFPWLPVKIHFHGYMQRLVLQDEYTREKTFDTLTSQVRIDPVVEVMGEDLAEADRLYEWTQQLTMDDIDLGSQGFNTRSLTQTSLFT